MNENIDLTQILKGCDGIELWSPLIGRCTLCCIDDTFGVCPIQVRSCRSEVIHTFTPQGHYLPECDRDDSVECLLFPSKDQREWSKFKKPSKFPKTSAEAHLMMTIDDEDLLAEDMRNFISLIEARNVYWKLDGNWKPHWSPLSANDKHCIKIVGDEIRIGACDIDRHTLVFPTWEMCYEFYENFKDLINSCKDYL